MGDLRKLFNLKLFQLGYDYDDLRGILKTSRYVLKRKIDNPKLFTLEDIVRIKRFIKLSNEDMKLFF